MLFSIAIGIILVLRIIIIIRLLYLIKNNKLTKSIFKPSFINNYIDNLQELTKSENLPEIVDFYYKHLYIYIFFLLIWLYERPKIK